MSHATNAGNADTATNATHASNADSATKIVNNGNRNNLANGTKPPSGLSVYQCYTHAGYPQQFGNVISIGGTGDNELFLGWHNNARPYYRNKVDVSNDWTSWKPLAFISDINNYAPTKTGGGASGTWNISISGNANTAKTLEVTDGVGARANSTFHWVGQNGQPAWIWGSNDEINNYVYNPANFHVAYANSAGSASSVAWGNVSDKPNLALKDGDTIYTNDWFRSRGDTGWYNETYCGGWYMTDSTWIRAFNNKSVYTPAKMQADGGFYGNLEGTATNADKLDGYHASDLLRTLGGNRTPVMTDIFDRAGTIDLTAMNATDKANNKAKINKSPNSLQNLWNNTTGIHAYGGDVDMANGYAHGTLKLTQSYKNFDKILVVACDDDAVWTTYSIWDTWELSHAFNSCFAFNIIRGTNIYWLFYGTQQHGTGKFAWSTDTVWSCREQNCGIIAIYGLSY